MPALTPAGRIGTTLAGKYRLDRILGAGGMGTVFAGVHAWTGREVAVKMLNVDCATDATVVQRFLQEARAAAKLHHPNVVGVLDMGQDEEGSVYLVLELMNGAPLADVVAQGPMSAEDTLTRLLPVIDALAVAHSRGIVHRDLKPDNIFLSRDTQGREVSKLLDFGIAKMSGGSSARTSTGFIVGTPLYMSPEQALGRSDLGPASDVWSMGVVLFQCLTGQLPFTGESPTGVLVNIVTQRAPGIRTMGVEVPSPLAQAVDRALNPDPLARFANGGELAEALRAAASSTVLAGTAVASSPRVRQSTDAQPPTASAALGHVVPTVTTPFTWASDDAGTSAAPPRTRVLLSLVAGCAALAGILLVGVIVAVLRTDGDGQRAARPPAVSVPSTVVPLEVALPRPPVVIAPVAVLSSDAGQLPGATAHIARASGKRLPAALAPIRVAAPIPRLAPQPPIAARQPAPPALMPHPTRERGANGALIVD